MQITVKLFANLAGYSHAEGLPGTPFEIEIESNATIKDVVSKLNLPEDLIKVTFVNGIVQSLEFKLSRGDELGIFPPIGGG